MSLGSLTVTVNPTCGASGGGKSQLAKLIAKDGITMNCVSPGFIDSGSAPDGELERMVKFIPAGYVGTVEDAAGAVRFLLSEEARYVNGASIQVSGGWGV